MHIDRRLAGALARRLGCYPVIALNSCAGFIGGLMLVFVLVNHI